MVCETLLYPLPRTMQQHFFLLLLMYTDSTKAWPTAHRHVKCLRSASVSTAKHNATALLSSSLDVHRLHQSLAHSPQARRELDRKKHTYMPPPGTSLSWFLRWSLCMSWWPQAPAYPPATTATHIAAVWTPHLPCIRPKYIPFQTHHLWKLKHSSSYDDMVTRFTWAKSLYLVFASHSCSILALSLYLVFASQSCSILALSLYLVFASQSCSILALSLYLVFASQSCFILALSLYLVFASQSCFILAFKHWGHCVSRQTQWRNLFCHISSIKKKLHKLL